MHQQQRRASIKFDPLSANVGDPQLPGQPEPDQTLPAEGRPTESIDWLSANVGQFQSHNPETTTTTRKTDNDNT